VDGLTDNVLVARTIIVVEDSDYIIDVILHQNAVVEAICSVTGSLTTHYYYSPDNQRSGYQVNDIRYYCVTFAESEPYCHSILFVSLSGCLSVIPRPTAYHD